MPLGTEVGLGLTRHYVRCRPSYPQKKGTLMHPTQFFAHVYCGQMAGWMKKPLGTEVDFGPCHIVLHGVPAPAKGHRSPSFRPMSIVATVAHLSYCWALVTICFWWRPIEHDHIMSCKLCMIYVTVSLHLVFCEPRHSVFVWLFKPINNNDYPIDKANT